MEYWNVFVNFINRFWTDITTNTYSHLATFIIALITQFIFRLIWKENKEKVSIALKSVRNYILSNNSFKNNVNVAINSPQVTNEETPTEVKIGTIVTNPTNWEKRYIQNSPIWFYKPDNRYSINTSNDLDDRKVDMKYVNHFPDKNAYKSTYYIKFNDLILEEYDLVDLDGARYTIPLPKHSMITDTEYNSYIERVDRSYQIAKIINNITSPYTSIEEVCQKADIEVKN